MPYRAMTRCARCGGKRLPGATCVTCAVRTGRLTTTGRGYGTDHQKLRAEWAPVVATGLLKCARCRKVIAADHDWDLGHDPIRPGHYRGPEHVSCNRDTKRGNDE